jgi:hypothetical protein
MQNNDSPDLQRTPQYTQPRRDIPVPEKDIYDPVADYNQGELAAMDYIEQKGFYGINDVVDYLIDQIYENRPEYVQGFADALEVIAKREA